MSQEGLFPTIGEGENRDGDSELHEGLGSDLFSYDGGGARAYYVGVLDMFHVTFGGDGVAHREYGDVYIFLLLDFSDFGDFLGLEACHGYGDGSKTHFDGFLHPSCLIDGGTCWIQRLPPHDSRYIL